jgi:Zn-dependent M28 family amino/carboxypeptidase
MTAIRVSSEVMAMDADPVRLRAHVTALAGERHPESSPAALAAAGELVADQLSGVGLRVERQAFTFRGRRYYNIVGTTAARTPDLPRILVGAHFDTVPGSPGADDNASGVAAMLETARLLAELELDAIVEFVGFNLEEPQGFTYRVGSRAYAKDARRRRVRYSGVFVLEMVGYTDTRRGSQSVPALLFWKRVPKTGTFLAVTGHRRSAKLLRTFSSIACAAVPDLQVVTFRTPLNGWLVPDTRLSDNASFWDVGYPALMLTDTAFLRNPNYHSATDGIGTLDFGFMGKVTDAVAAVAARQAGPNSIK